MKCVVLTLIALFASLTAQDPRVRDPDPAALMAMLARADVKEPARASCGGEIRAGHPNEFAVALGTDAGGRYALIQDDGVLTDLSEYEGSPMLNCYTLREADKLTSDIARSDTVSGRVTAEWDGLVVCGSLRPDITVCWQHAPERKAFVRVGGWTR